MAQYGGHDQSGYGQGNRYNQQAGNPYAQSGNPYSQQQSNPYAQQPNPYAQQQGSSYGQQGGNPYAQQSSNPYAQQNPQPGAYGAASNDIEMGHMNGQAPAQRDEFALLNEVSEIDKALKILHDQNIPAIRSLQQQVLDDTRPRKDNPLPKQLDALDAETMAAYRNFTVRITKLKGKPGAGNDTNRPQIKKTQDKVQAELSAYQTLQVEYRRKCEEQLRRTMRQANANITDQEMQQAIESGIAQQGVFARSLEQSTRRGEAASVLRAAQDRSADIQKINQAVMEIAELNQQLNALVTEQGEMIVDIEKKTKDVEEDNRGANGQLTVAVDKARAARKKKWICLGICVAIVIIIAAALAGYFATHKNS
ncbi:Plasma membrane t-SNARE, secretory vesicle fusion [Thelotrema lepadinum]|nr:Plasma membrane t-SNARE, secretory vesicle fusion [Thelotrema lepadinum]